MSGLGKIKFLVGNNNFQKNTIPPYDKKICDFLSDLSDELNSSVEAKNFPDVKTLAFYCRKANVENLSKQYLTKRIVYICKLSWPFYPLVK